MRTVQFAATNDRRHMGTLNDCCRCFQNDRWMGRDAGMSVIILSSMAMGQMGMKKPVRVVPGVLEARWLREL